MAKILIHARFKTRVFFNTAAVRKRVGRATVSVLSKFGAFVRQTAKSSIRRSKRSSPPGTPPRSHTGLLKRRILFWFDLVRRSVVIGPELARPAGDQILHALEVGGVTRASPRRRKGRRGDTKRGPKRRIAARPFMGPALQENLPLLPLMWRNSVRR